MKRSLAFGITIFLLFQFIISNHVQAKVIHHGGQDSCTFALLEQGKVALELSPAMSQVAQINMASGKSTVRLSCSLSQQAVFGFQRYELLGFEWNDPEQLIRQLKASNPSFILPVGDFTVSVDINNHHEFLQEFVWQDFASYSNHSLINNITMGAFYGLCLTLIFYVFCLGRILGEKRFELYSIYVFCAATFFLLQEGQLGIFFPDQSFILSHQLYVIFAGLTVFTATKFIVRLTDLQIAWPNISLYGLQWSASLVLLISIAMLFLDHNQVTDLLGSVMAYSTLLIMLTILCLVIIQSCRGVKMAWLVLFSLILMVLAMTFRIVFMDVNTFLNRYGLIFAFSVEAFMFAVAVSSRIKDLKLERTQAQTDANTDVLCNVLNRRGWDNKAGDFLEYHKKNAGVLSILYIDMNDFKYINDTYGHDCGDHVLIIVAKIIQNQLRSKDALGRVGGDEFVVIGHFDYVEEAQHFARRVNERLQSLSLRIDGQDCVETSASVGHVMFEESPTSVAHMLKSADGSMYAAKRERNAPFVSVSQ